MTRYVPGPRARAIGEEAQRRLVAGSQDWIRFSPSDAIPIFFERGRGPHLFDPDGRRFIDLYCMSGAVILGHGHAELTRALTERIEFGTSVSFRHPIEVELARWFRERMPFAERSMFFKTGSEAAKAALQAALAQRSKSAAISIGYHGWHSPFMGGWPLPGAVDIAFCGWDLAEVDRVLDERIGAIIVSPDASQLDPAFYLELQRRARRVGAAFIMDEIKSGFRARFPCLSVAFGLDPDVALFSKAIANGFPVSVLTGKEEILSEPRLFSMFSTFASETLSLFAMKTTLELLEKKEYARFERASTALYRGLGERLAPFGIRTLGDPTFFKLTFPSRERALEFAARLAGENVVAHPFDAVVCSAAHDDPEVIEQALQAACLGAANEP